MFGRARFLIIILAIFGLVAAPQAAAAAIRMNKIYFDPPGEDSAPEPNSDLNKERVVICNTAGRRRSLSRWKLVDRGPDHRYTFPGRFKLRGNRCVTVHTGTAEAAMAASTFTWTSTSISGTTTVTEQP